MGITDDGAKQLIAAILKQAHEDYIGKESCPSYCPKINSCKHTKDFCDAKIFIHSAWCATLCDGIDINHNEYAEKTIDKCKLTKNTVKYIEGELRAYYNNLKLIDAVKNDIIFESPIFKEGKSYDVGNPTLTKAIRIDTRIYTDKQLKRINDTVNAIKNTYNRSTKEKREILDNIYFKQRYTAEGMACRLNVDRRTVFRWRTQIVYDVAKELNYL